MSKMRENTTLSKCTDFYIQLRSVIYLTIRKPNSKWGSILRFRTYAAMSINKKTKKKKNAFVNATQFSHPKINPQSRDFLKMRTCSRTVGPLLDVLSRAAGEKAS